MELLQVNNVADAELGKCAEIPLQNPPRDRGLQQWPWSAISFISIRVLWLPRLCLQLTPGDGRPKNVAASRDRSVAWLSLDDAGMFPVPLNHPVAPLQRKTGTWQNE